MTNARRAGMVGTAVVHFALIAAAVWSARRATEPLTRVYAVELVAASPAPAAAKTSPKAPAPVKTPDAAPVLKPKKTPPAKTPPVKTPNTPVKEVTPPVTKPVEPAKPNETPKNGLDVANVSIPGFQTRYPEYINNIYNQILKRFPSEKPRIGAPVAEVRFRIRADGSVDNLSFVVKSNNTTFNNEAMSAVEGAGNQKAFGQLPDGIPELEISFTFKPRQGS